MANFFWRAWTVFFVLVLATAGTASGDEHAAIPAAYAPRPAVVASHDFYRERAYLDEMSPRPRIHDKRRIRLRYDRAIEMGQTKMLLRLKASPKPRKLVRFELRF